MKKIAILVFLATIFFSCAHRSEASGYVFDEASILTVQQAHTLDSLFRAHEQKTTNQIVLKTIISMHQDTNLHVWSTQLFNKLGVGTKEKNNGVLIVFCSECRRIEIVTGKGTEKKLTDDKLRYIINNSMLPLFGKEEYFQGFYRGSVAIVEFLERPENKIGSE